MRMQPQNRIKGFFAWTVPRAGVGAHATPHRAREILRRLRRSASAGCNAIDKPVRECDALNRCTTHVYDNRGNESSTTYPDGTFESKTFDPNGNVATHTDCGGRVTKFVHDAANRLTQTIHPDTTPASDGDNPRTRSVYDPAGRLVTSTNENFNSTTYTYDTANRQIATTDVLGNVTRTEYDSAGRKTASVDALGRRTTFTYDNAGRVLSTTFTDGSSTRTEYDALGRKTADVDESGTRRTYAYDALGRLTGVTLAAGTPDATTTAYAYNEQGQKISQTDALGRETKWTFDRVGRETSRTLPLGQIESFEHDLVGRRIAHVDFNGQRLIVAYDLADRPIRTTYADGRVETQSFDGAGNRTSQTSPEGTWSWLFDARNRMTRETQPNDVVFDYEHDPVGNRTLARYTIGTGAAAIATTTFYSFDAANRLVQTQRGSNTIVYGYDPVGNRTSERQGPITTTNAFDARNRVTSIESRRGATTLQRYAYTLDATGKRTRIEETDSTGIPHSTSYTYDPLNRLTGEAHSRQSSVVRTAGFGFDAVGNRVSVVEDGVTRGATFDGNDRLVTQGSETFTYDANGNQTAKMGASGSVAYAYDARNKLLSATDSANGARTSLVYDAGGNRTERRTRASTTAPEVLTRFVVDNNRGLPEVVAERDEAANAVTHYLHAHDLALQVTVAPGSSSTHYTLRDGLGRTRYLADANGAITDTLRYSAWGESVARTGTTNIAHQFAGEAWEPSLGLSYNRARFYAPSQARFTQMDWFEGFDRSPASLHKFAYANFDPVNHVDPSGYYSLAQAGVAFNVLSTLATTALRAFTLYSALDTAANEAGTVSTLLTSLILSTVGGPGGLASTAASNASFTAPGHHTIPEYLCGHPRQTVVRLPFTEHTKIHAALYGVRVSALLGQKLVVEKLLRRPTVNDKNNDRFLLGGNSVGRAAIATTIQYVYEVGDWMNTGVLPIGTVFPRERSKYVQGYTSYPTCRKRP